MFGIGRNSEAIVAFSTALVEELVKRFPPEKQAELGGTKLKPAQHLAKAVNTLERSVVGFANELKLGVYGKAKLLNSIKWQLKERGYSPEFVDATTATLAQAIGSRK